VTADTNLSRKQNFYHNRKNIALVLLSKERGQAHIRGLATAIHEISDLSGSCQLLWFKILALEADGPGLPLQHYGMEAGKAGGYVSFHRLEILA